jgi:hypothetical protein
MQPYGPPRPVTGISLPFYLSGFLMTGVLLQVEFLVVLLFIVPPESSCIVFLEMNTSIMSIGKSECFMWIISF